MPYTDAEKDDLERLLDLVETVDADLCGIASRYDRLDPVWR